MDSRYALTVLGRLLERRAQTRSQLVHALLDRPNLFPECLRAAELAPSKAFDTALAQIVAAWPTHQACTFHNDLPEHTTALRETGLAITAACWRYLNAHPEAEDRDRYLAEIGNNLVTRLSELGRQDEAASAADELVGHFRDCKDRDPEGTRHLARSLYTRGMVRGRRKQGRDAITDYEEAAKLLRGLNDVETQDLYLSLGLVLNNLAGQCLAANQHEKALESALEAVAIHRRYERCNPGADREPKRNQANLAAALGVLANVQVARGEFEAAHAVAQKAEGILRTLTEDNRERFRAQWAMALNNLAMTKQRLGRQGEAADILRLVAEEYVHLADTYPEAFLEDCSRVHRNLAIAYGAIHRPDEALPVAEKAIEHGLRFADEPWVAGGDPASEALGVYLSLQPYKLRGQAGLERLGVLVADLANRRSAGQQARITWLIDTGRRLKETDRLLEGLVLTSTAADQVRPLADGGGINDLSLLCTALVGSLSIQAKLPHPDAIHETAAEAIDRLATLARGGDRARANAALLLNNLANALSQLDLPDLALDAARLAVAHFRDLAPQNPEQFEPHLAVALSTLARRLGTCGLQSEARSVASEAVRKLAPYTRSSPERYGSWLAEMTAFEQALRDHP